MSGDKPRLRALVGFFAPTGLIKKPRFMLLEHVVDFKPIADPDDTDDAAFFTLVDPQDQEDLARWEQIQRSLTTRARGWLRD